MASVELEITDGLVLVVMAAYNLGRETADSDKMTVPRDIVISAIDRMKAGVAFTAPGHDVNKGE